MHFRVGKCPHCKIQKMTHDLFGVGQGFNEDGQHFISASFQCRNCSKPHAAALAENNAREDALYLKDGSIEDSNIESLGWYVYETWPSSDDFKLSNAVPARIREIFSQAESNYFLDMHQEASALMYRKAIEAALLDLKISGRSLNEKIEALIAEKRLGQEVADWAHEVRLIGNEAAHQYEPPSKADVADLRGLTEILLRMLFVIPSLIKRRREAAAALRKDDKLVSG